MTHKIVFLLALLGCTPFFSGAQERFSVFFTGQTLRIDYLLAGTDTTTDVCLLQMKKEKAYGGSRKNLVDERNYGTFRYRLFDLQTGSLIFSKGFCPLFQEWQTTPEASKTKRSFNQVAILPFPSAKVKFVIERKDRNEMFYELFSVEIDPEDYFIIDESAPGYVVDEIIRNGDPADKVDLVFIPDGYRAEEMDKFRRDAERMTKYLFAADPFRECRDDFNVYGVEVLSEESGTDVPGERQYRNTAFDASFYTFDEPRYLTTTAMQALHDAASVVPYDHICVLVNSARYGGGGFYNFLTVTTSDNRLASEVFVHEIGHALAGLADEYYTSSVAYDNYYNPEVEPWEPNITTMVDFDRKWKHLLDKKTPVPTPRTPEFDKTVGVFEGGGYMEKGIFSPMMDCRMKSNEAEGFCPVCREAILKAIEWYCR